MVGMSLNTSSTVLQSMHVLFICKIRQYTSSKSVPFLRINSYLYSRREDEQNPNRKYNSLQQLPNYTSISVEFRA